MDCVPIVLAHEPTFRIGDAEFRPSTREALLNGYNAVLEPRVMQLLVALHRAQGGVVTKDELIQQCWDGRVVGEDAINRVVSRLRSVSDKIGNPFKVETITKVGYRLAPPNGHANPPGFARPRGQGAQRASLLLDRRILLIGGAASAALAAGAFSWKYLRRDELPSDVRLLVEDAETAFLTEDPDEHGNAVAQLREAAKLAPESALVWGLMALGYMKQMIVAPPAARGDLRSRGLAAARRALAIEPDQPDARAATLHAIPVFRNWLNYEQACRSAVGEHPDHFQLNSLLGLVMSQVGRLAEVLPMAENCFAKAPRHAGVHLWRAVALFEQGRFDEAEAGYQRAFELWPRSTGVWFSWLYFLMYNNRADEALTLVRNTAKRPLGLPDRNFDLVELKAKALVSGDPARIRGALSEWENAAREGTGFAENAAKFAAHVGDHDMVFRLLDALYFGRGMPIANSRFGKEQGTYAGAERLTHFLFWRSFRSVRRDPRFTGLIGSLGLTDYWKKSGSLSKVAI